MSAFADEIKAAVREAVREEVRAALAEFHPALVSEPDHHLNVKEAAARLGLSTSTIYKLAEKCELPSFKMGTRLLFRSVDLDSYAQARRRSPGRVAEIAAAALRKP